MAAALEVKSSHPVAAGIVNHYSSCVNEKIANLGTGVGLPDVANFRSISGLGVLGHVEGRLVGIGNLKMLEDFNIDVSKEIEDLYSDWSEDGHTVVFVVINNKVRTSWSQCCLGPSPESKTKHTVIIFTWPENEGRDVTKKSA